MGKDRSARSTAARNEGGSVRGAFPDFRRFPGRFDFAGPLMQSREHGEEGDGGRDDSSGESSP